MCLFRRRVIDLQCTSNSKITSVFPHDDTYHIPHALYALCNTHHIRAEIRTLILHWLYNSLPHIRIHHSVISQRNPLPPSLISSLDLPRMLRPDNKISILYSQPLDKEVRQRLACAIWPQRYDIHHTRQTSTRTGDQDKAALS
jgi:hypothetical protein